VTARLAVVGGSWGGARAARAVLGRVDPTCRLAITVALHRAAEAPHGALVGYLSSVSQLPVTEVDDKDVIEPRHVYVAPPDYHLLVEPGRFSLSIDELVRFSRPSIDVLFESAADAYGDEIVGVLLTGANSDGCRGLLRIKARGGRTIVQCPATAERREMPAAAVAAGAADDVLPLEGIAAVLNEMGMGQ
jgi:two-component system chemotaxis response regulator CheB